MTARNSKSRLFTLLCGVCMLCVPGAIVAQDAPLSAIPWLSDSLNTPQAAEEPPVSGAAPPTEISVTPLGSPQRQAAGLMPAPAARLPRDLWSGSDGTRLADLMRTMPHHRLPAAQDLFETLVLVEAEPPKSSSETLLLARIDALLLRGQLEAAQSLLERIGPDTPELFRRWFDVGLLTGTEDRACATLAAKPELNPNYETRVFCLARSGRWPTAALTLETAAALDAIDAETRERLTKFLDPELFEGLPPSKRPDPITPLDFRLLEAVGEPVPSNTLPLAFAQSDLRHIVGWKAQIEAAERLAEAGSLSPNVLLGLYTQRPPAASGGVWDRVALMQALDIALMAGDAEGARRWLEPARRAMSRVGLEPVFANLVASRLHRLPLTGAAAQSAYELALMSNSSVAFEPPPPGLDLQPDLAALAVLANGDAEADIQPEADLSGLVSAFAEDGLSDADAALLAENRMGEALLVALARLSPDAEADTDDVVAALRLLRHVGHGDAARHIALQRNLMDSTS